MAIQVQGNSGVVAEVGGTAFRALHVHIKPLEYGALGHYQTFTRIASTAAQTANSRFWEIRNTHATNLIIPTRIIVRGIQKAAGTAQENSLDLFKVTGFTAVDTTNTVTPTASVKCGATMAAYPGGAAPRHLTLTGNASGMTGGTLTKDGNLAASFPLLINTAVPTTANPIWGPVDMLQTNIYDHPWVFVQNEGWEIENRVLNVTSYGFTFYFDIAWAEVTAF